MKNLFIAIILSACSMPAFAGNLLDRPCFILKLLPTLKEVAQKAATCGAEIVEKEKIDKVIQSGREVFGSQFYNAQNPDGTIDSFYLLTDKLDYDTKGCELRPNVSFWTKSTLPSDESYYFFYDASGMSINVDMKKGRSVNGVVCY